MTVPNRCNICHGEVMYAPSSYVYHGRDYGSGYVYVCRKCGAYVGTHRNSPRCAMGLLADNEMRALRQRCHELFDGTWRTAKERTQRYEELAGLLGIEPRRCHFAWMDKKTLMRAIAVMEAAQAVIKAKAEMG